MQPISIGKHAASVDGDCAMTGGGAEEREFQENQSDQLDHGTNSVNVDPHTATLVDAEEEALRLQEEEGMMGAFVKASYWKTAEIQGVQIIPSEETVVTVNGTPENNQPSNFTEDENEPSNEIDLNIVPTEDIVSFNGSDWRGDSERGALEGGATRSELDTGTTDGNGNTENATTDGIPLHMVPKSGMAFSFLEDVYTFYLQYARRKGFGVRKDGGKKYEISKELYYYRYICSCEGFDEASKDGEQLAACNSRKRMTQITRTGCTARLFTSLQGGKWVVTTFDPVHNHELLPETMTHFLPSQRTVSKEKRNLISHLQNVNIPSCKQYRLLASQSGNTQGAIGCTQKDLLNAKQKERDELAGHDAETFMMYMESKKKKNAAFQYKVVVDDSNTFRGCYWSDAKSRRSYEYFGDCVILDSTYRTNKYNLIFATIAGVNHHRQTIVFGCALLGDERTSTYKWLLETWLATMPSSKQPGIIITDQDPALRNAIADVMPNTFHRFCIWHILQKFENKLAPSAKTLYSNKLKEIIRSSSSREAFELKWIAAISEYGLYDNEWLWEVYNMRDKWVPAFCNHVFSAGMSSSQRVESSHSFFKRYFSYRNTLVDFITRFDLAMRFQRENELHSNYLELRGRPRTKTMFAAEQHMARIYTMNVFKLFQKEVFKSQEFLFVEEVCKTEAQETFVIKIDRDDIGTALTYIKDRNTISCECKFWDFEGIPCSHILFYYRYTGEGIFPDQYILNRWTKEATSRRVWENSSEIVDDPKQNLLLRQTTVSKECQVLSELACLSSEATDLAVEGIRGLIEQIRMLNKNSGRPVEDEEIDEIPPDILGVQDPPAIRTKGCGSGGRLKRPREIDEGKQSRVCGGCGKARTGHNIRTCPNTKDKQ